MRPALRYAVRPDNFCRILQRTFHSFRKFQCDTRQSVIREKWESVVGLEVHAQIQTKSKLFSGAENKFSAQVNSLVSPLDLAEPGTLPVLNRGCVEAGVMTALTLNCRVNPVSEFDRKHYFYADMPAGYQITQQRNPLASEGHLDFVVYNPAFHKTAFRKRSSIKQLQLEQDSGRSLHDEFSNRCLIDLNRAGVGLMEIVFEPDLSTGDEAASLVSELVKILTGLGTCNCKMEEGALRVDANVSVRRPGGELGTRTEIKNMNSLRAVCRAIDYEIERQIKILEGGGVITNETRGYDSQLKATVQMRDKEMKQDYRFMPEPNLPPLRLSELGLSLDKIRSSIPTLPDEERRMLMDNYNLGMAAALQLVDDARNLAFFKGVMELRPDLNTKSVCSLFLTDLVGMLNKDGMTVDKCSVTCLQFARVVELLQKGVISRTASQELLGLLYLGDPRDPQEIVEEKKWTLIAGEDVLETICRQVLADNADTVKAYRSGKTKVLNKLFGQLKKSCNNNFDMALATGKLKQILDDQRVPER